MLQEKAINVSILDDELLSADDVLMVPSLGILSSRSEAEIDPYIYSSPMDTVTGYELTKAMVEQNQFPVVCRFLKDEWTRCLEEFHDNPDVFFAIGSRNKDVELLLKELKRIKPTSGPPTAPLSVAVDIAHGDTEHAHAVYKWLASQPFIGRIMSGSVCTPDAALRAYQSGCTHIRVGIGPGSACTTRVMTGCGMPQLSAVYFTYKMLKAVGAKCEIIADGGVRSPGDANKYLAAGATGVMMGSAFSRTEESAGWQLEPKQVQHSGTITFPLKREYVKVKAYRGQASAEFQKDNFGKSDTCPEGASTGLFEPSGTCSSVIEKYSRGLSSAISYLGLRSSTQMCPEQVRFIKLTQSAYMEGTPHGCK